MKNEKISKNLRTADYYVGLDIGTDSVGYAAVNPDYTLCKHKGEPMWGAALFDAADKIPGKNKRRTGTAARRGFRTARRRLKRRQQRVKLIQDIFAAEIAKVDKNFYTTLRESGLYAEDASASTGAGREWLNKNYREKYPTIHHLIYELMTSDEKHDIRLIYIACAWLVAHRGHFLSDISAGNAEKLADIKPVYDEFVQWFTDNGYDVPWECDAEKFGEIISKNGRGADKENELLDLIFGGKKPKDNAEEYPFSKHAMIKLVCGSKLKAEKLFIADESVKSVDESLNLASPDKLEEVLGELGENAELVRKLSQLYDCAVLSKTWSEYKQDSEEEIIFISQAKIAQYNRHKSDLKELKYLVKKYCSKKEYNEMFRGESKSGYSSYVTNFKSNEDDKYKSRVEKGKFYEAVQKLLENINANDKDDTKIKKILERIELGTYMPKQVNSDNRVIPHQLYYVELKKLLENATKTHGFLSEKDESGFTAAEKILSVFTFKIPYFVGPLNKNNSDHAWIEKKSDEKIYPWNFDKIVDFDKCEQAFINRMTNRCSYLASEDVLPKNSLLYCKFTVLNEINNLKIDGKKISVEMKQDIFNTLFMPNGHNKAKVTRKAIVGYLVSHNVIGKDEEMHISGIDDEIKSNMKPAFDFYSLKQRGILNDEQIEEIIRHSTYTEDRARFKKWLEGAFNLDPADIKYISAKRYADFGRLSHKLLNGLEGVNKTDKSGTTSELSMTGEPGTVMHFMWNTNDNFMQIIADEEKYTFKKSIEDENSEYYAEHPLTMNELLEEMGVSNAVKRPIMRTLEIMSDIVKAKGAAPKKIFVEMPRGASPDQKNKRTVSRKTTLTEAYKAIKSPESRDMIQAIEHLGDDADRRLQSESLFLYFQQMRKCMYCGKPLDMAYLGTERYNIDHIWPQSYIKDDSIHNNKVLVHSEENAAKGDNYPIKSDIREKMTPFWSRLLKADLITDTKYHRLVRNTTFTDDEKMGFINRQLVETSQSAKAVTQLLKKIYPEPKTKIVFVKAGLVSDFRNEYGEIKNTAFRLGLSNEEKRAMKLTKCRSLNDTHHANDAYLNAVVGNVYNERFAKKWFNVSTDKYSMNYKTLFGNELKFAPEVWSPQKHLPIVDKVMDNKHIHLTKYQICQKGGLFKQNPLKAGNGSLVPRKKKLDPLKYGGYEKSAATFFALVGYKIKDKKGIKDKKELTLLPVDLIEVKKFRNSSVKYAADKLGDKASEITFPLGDRILKVNTVFSLDGFEVCIAGKKTGGLQILFRSLMTSYISKEYVSYAKSIEKVCEKIQSDKDYVVDEKYDRISTEMNMKFYDELCSKLNGKTFSKMPGSGLKLTNETRDSFEKLDIKLQLECLSNIILFMKTNRAGSCNMQSVSGSKTTGEVILSANLSNWKYSDIRIIDRSASGIFEKRSQNLKELL